MTMRSGWLRVSVLLGCMFGLIADPVAEANGSRGGHPRVAAARARAPRVPSPQRMAHVSAPKAVRVPHAVSASRGKVATRSVASPAHSTGAHTGSKTTNTAIAHSTNNAGHSSNIYSYGTGRGTRHYTARGYGRGYRNHYYGSRRGYGNSQSQNRAVVARLRSVHSTLMRIDHDYSGHRARAAHSISMAIRQLSHRSMRYSSSNSSMGMNNGMAVGMRNNNNLGGAGRQRLTQAQSDSRMSQALRTTQGINMQLTHQGNNSTTHARARGHVQLAIREMSHALAIR